MTALATLAALVAAIGLLQAALGAGLVWRFVRRSRGAEAAVTVPFPPITVLKPLHGNEPLLERALATLCQQDYPRFQIVFGVQSADDPALAVVARLQRRFPGCDIAVCVDAAAHGRNRKIGNLTNMLPAARHDWLVIADSDVHAAPDYLRRLAATLQRPGVGLATTLYAGLAAHPVLAGALGASAITHGFLPGALTARAIGRQDCLGATMALRRETLEAVGGLPALVHHLADDHVLGTLVQRLGLRVALADTVPLTTVPETRIGALFRHELRWSRTIRALVPVGFAFSAVQYPLAWAVLALLLSGGAGWACALLLGAWAMRAGLARLVDRLLRLSTTAPLWLLPLRDLMSVAVMLTAYAGHEVEWRGQIMRAGLSPTMIEPLPLGTEQP